jgi:AbrB family looped-hinge helix DNA binding protein
VRINIPAVIRDTLEIKPGDSLVMECYIDNGKKLAIMKKQED